MNEIVPSLKIDTECCLFLMLSIAGCCSYFVECQVSLQMLVSSLDIGHRFGTPL